MWKYRLQRLSNADDGFNKSIAAIFALASKAHDLFKSSELEEKRRIITIFVSELTNEWLKTNTRAKKAL